MVWLRTWYHSYLINDNRKRRYPERGYDESHGSILRQGRWHFDYGKKPLARATPKGKEEFEHPHKFHFEWCLFRRGNNAALGVTFSTDEGYETALRFGLPWILSLHVSHSAPVRFMRWLLPWYSYEAEDAQTSGWPLSREIEVYLFEWTVWVNLWVHPMNSDYGDYGNTPVSKWRHFNFTVNPLDLLGSRRCTTEILEPKREVFIPMPEGEYPAALQVEQRIWKRKLWPWWPLKLVRVSRDIDCDIGIPFSGKGENSWDCGEDGIYGTGFNTDRADTDQKACALYAASALETRVRRGDPRVWPEAPSVRAERVATMRAEHVTTSGGASPDQQEPLQ